MRLLRQRGQALLLLVVGGLAVAVVLGAGLVWYGLPAPVASIAAQLVAPRRSHLPARVEVDIPAPSPAGGTTVTSASAASPDPETVVVPVGRLPVQPSPAMSVVPAVIYTYPPDDHGGGSGGGGTSHGGR